MTAVADGSYETQRSALIFAALSFLLRYPDFAK